MNNIEAAATNHLNNANLEKLFSKASPRKKPQGSLTKIPKLIRHFLFVWVSPINVVLFTFLPIFFFSIFGLGQDYSDQSIGRASVSARILVSMALYGMMFMSAGATARIGTEQSQGWIRQMSLTPIKPVHYGLARLSGASVLTTFAGVLIYAYGLWVGVEIEWPALWQSFLIQLVGILIGALFGLFTGLLIPTDAAQGTVGGLSSLIAFIGGVFIPLDQMATILQKIAPYTPMWGINELLKQCLQGWSDFPTKPIISVIAWILVFSVSSLLLARRSTRR